MSIKTLVAPITLLLIFWLGKNLVWPTWKNYRENHNKIQKIIEDKNILQKKFNNVQRAGEDFRNLSKIDREMIAMAVPERINDDDLVAEINKNAKQSGVLIISLNIDSPVEKECLPKPAKGVGATKVDPQCLNSPEEAVPASLTFVGSYPAILTFLRNFDIANRVNLTKELKIRRVDDGAEKKMEDEAAGGSKDNLTASQPADASEADQEAEESSGLLNVTMDFLVYQTPKVMDIKLSKVIQEDKILQSLMKKGLESDILGVFRKVINGKTFYPVSANGVGKDNPFSWRRSLPENQAGPENVEP